MMRRPILVVRSVLVALILGCVPVIASTPTGNDCSQLLPQPVKRLLARQYPSWKVTALPDLLPEDRKLWRESPYRKGDCPGVAVGHFERRDRLSYGVLLIRRRGDKTYNMLLLASQVGRGKWRLSVLDKEREVAFTTAIWKMPPGQYSNWDDTERVRITLDGIVNEQIEAWSIMYYWRRGDWHQIRLSD